MSQARSSIGAGAETAAPRPEETASPARPAPTVELTGGTVNGRYRLTATPSQWAVGTAHPAVDLLDHELVVLVYPSIPPGRDMEFYRRAAAEVERTRGLRGTSLVCMRDCGALANGRPYFVMQRVQAHSVQKYVAERGPIAVDAAVHLLDQILLLAGRAHGFGVVLGDIRPANIFVTESRGSDARTFLTPTVVDTGYARGLFDGLIALPEPPAAYRSPQRRRGEAASIADDIYALGALLSFLVTGRAPRISTGEVLDAAAWGPSRIRPDLRITPLLDRIVLRCLEPRPDARWRSVEAMRESLEALRQLLTLPRAARNLLDELLTQPPASAEPLGGQGSLGGLAQGPRAQFDVPTVEIAAEPSDGGAPSASPASRPRADTMPFDPRDVATSAPPEPVAATTTPPGPLPAGAPAGVDATGNRPLQRDQLRRLLRVIDSAEPEPPADAVPPGSQPLDPPRFSLLKGQAPTVSPAVRPVTGSHVVVAPVFTPAPPHWLTETAGQAAPPTAAQAPDLDADETPRIRSEAPTRPVPEPGLAVLVEKTRSSGEAPASRPRTGPLPGTTAPLVRLDGSAEAAEGRLRSTGPQLRFGDAAPATEPAGRVTGTLPAATAAEARGPLGRGNGAGLSDVEPLNLPADVHAIPPVDAAPFGSGDSSGPHVLHRWRLALAAGGGLACVAALAFFAFQGPGPSAPAGEATRASVGAGYLPSAAVPARISPPVDVSAAPASVDAPVAPATISAPAAAATVSAPAPATVSAPASPSALLAAKAPSTATRDPRDREDAPVEAVRVEDPFAGEAAAGELPPGKIAAQIRTVPVAARVVRFKSGETMCSSTPCRIVHTRLKAGTRMRLRLEAPGYAPRDAYIKVDETSDVEFRLEAQGSAAPAPGPVTPAAPALAPAPPDPTPSAMPF